ncbi:MAG: hypothetical protein M1839_003909 [Geoglossum umbratile]|nr:MAG: hypothetical protein M1839_003909 [Geoglossum umbratile]
MLVTGPNSIAPTEMLDFKKAIRRISTIFTLGRSTNNDLNPPRMADPNRASRLSLAAVSASSRSRSSSPGGRKLGRSIQMPYRSSPDPLALEPTEFNREKRNSRPPSPSLAPSPLNTGFAATLDSLPTRRKWLPRSRNASEERKPPHRSSAWLVTGEGHQDYDLSHLRDSARVRTLPKQYILPEANSSPYLQVPELWDESGDTYVYTRADAQHPSFRVSSSLLASSASLTLLAHGNLYSTTHHRSSSDGTAQGLLLEVSLDSKTVVPKTEPSEKEDSEGSRTLSDSLDGLAGETHLYFPTSLSTDGQALPPQTVGSSLTPDDIEVLVSTRNLFAFLAHRPLVATPQNPTYFSIFLAIGDLLKKHQFSNFDGSSFGETAGNSFSQYITELGLDDFRQSQEKTIEGIILGEALYSWNLYNESFVHAVGKYDSLVKLNHPKFNLISDVTRKRLERAAMDLQFRLNSVTPRLSEFEFPSLFAGIANSTLENKTVDFKAWKASFLSLRKHVMGVYKDRYGSWPPKASSKKNQFEVSGLNRLVVKDLYQDFCDLYDLLVDRSQFTPRTTDVASDPDDNPDSEEPTPRALRRVLSEYDRSTPPVLPPVPFDTPRLPSLAPDQSLPGAGDKKTVQERMKKVKDDKMIQIIYDSYNLDADKSSPFLESYKAFEWKAAHGKTVNEVRNQRNGYWIFVYAILQCLPMVVIDAPDIKWHQGVEYFLCVPPKGGAPWSRDEGSRRKSWYGIAGGTNSVSLPSHIVDHGIEGIFRRSHCWAVAEAWASQGSVIAGAVVANLDDPLPPPGLSGRNNAPDRRSIVSLGLEVLPVPAGLLPDSAVSRSSPTLDPNKGFDDILGAGVGGQEKKKWKKKSEHAFGFLS